MTYVLNIVYFILSHSNVTPQQLYLQLTIYIHSQCGIVK